MALSVSELQVMLDALKRARYSGALSVTVTIGAERRTIDYKSDLDMQKAIAALEGDISTAAGGRDNARFTVWGDGSGRYATERW